MTNFVYSTDKPLCLKFGGEHFAELSTDFGALYARHLAQSHVREFAFVEAEAAYRLYSTVFHHQNQTLLLTEKMAHNLNQLVEGQRFTKWTRINLETLHDLLLNVNMGLAFHFTNNMSRYPRNLQGNTQNDLMQIAMMGLSNGLKEYGASRDLQSRYQLSTIAYNYMRTEFSKWNLIGRAGLLKNQLSYQLISILKVKNKLESESPFKRFSVQEIADEYNKGKGPTGRITAESVADYLLEDYIERTLITTGIIDHLDMETLDRQFTVDYIDTRNLTEEQRLNPLDDYMATQLDQFIDQTLAQLNPRQQYIMRTRYFTSRGTLEEIASSLGLGREIVRLDEAKALRRLRHPARADYLRDFH